MNESIENKLVSLLIKNNLRITSAESCTGGMIASHIVNVPDASKVFDAGFVTYADFAKTKFINVDSKLIEKYGVVSEPVAAAMAEGAKVQAGADIAVSTTGIAGPGGGSESTPVGTVCFGFYLKGKVYTETVHFRGDRMDVRNTATDYALNKIYDLVVHEVKLANATLFAR
ncbi:MAG: CinA family protein [Lachnospiraceae bacterium]